MNHCEVKYLSPRKRASQPLLADYCRVFRPPIVNFTERLLSGSHRKERQICSPWTIRRCFGYRQACSRDCKKLASDTPRACPAEAGRCAKIFACEACRPRPANWIWSSRHGSCGLHAKFALDSLCCHGRCGHAPAGASRLGLLACAQGPIKALCGPGHFCPNKKPRTKDLRRPWNASLFGLGA